jgi:hypothetical protein
LAEYCQGVCQKGLIGILAISAILALSGFGYAWIAPWSDDMGILLMEPLAVGLALVLFGAATLLLLRVFRRLYPQSFVGGWTAASLGMAVLLGIALSIYLYPPMKRMLEPTQEAMDTAARLAERLKSAPPWDERLSEKSLQSVEWKVAPAPKGFFGWSPRDPWIARFSFRYRDGAVAEATYRLAESGASLERLMFEPPVQP